MDALQKKRLRQEKKNFARRQHRQEAREALCVKEYLRHKYPEAYEEACAFYNFVNSIYPTKPDLRRTEEFKALKNGFIFVAKNKDKVLTKPVQVYQPIANLTEQDFIIHSYKVPETAMQEPQIQLEEIEQTVTETPQIQPEEIEQTVTETPQIQPEEIEQTVTETPQIQPEEIEQTVTETPQIQPEEIEQTVTETPQIQPEEMEQPATEIPQTTNQNNQTKIMQLNIPLLSPKLITETRKTVTLEIIEDSLTVACNQTIPEDIKSIINDEIPQEVYEAIVSELRQDPELTKIMDDIELFDDTDIMDVDLPIQDYRLEEELYNLW